jgi:hypothetical protein
MDATQPLRDVFAGLAGAGGAGEPATVLAANGHEDLPDGLIAEAVVNYADTAPVEVAEHLAPFVRAHSAVPGAADAAPSWLAAVGSAPTNVDAMGLDPAGPGHDLDDVGAGASTAPSIVASDDSGGTEDHYGHGDTAADGQAPGDARWSTPDQGPDLGAPHPDPTVPPSPGPAEGPGLGYLGEEQAGDDLDSDPADLDDLG